MNFDWFAQNPLNYYECWWCGQHYKCNEDPEVVMKDSCFRCNMSKWDIREGTRMTPSFNTWEERLKWSENCAQHEGEF